MKAVLAQFIFESNTFNRIEAELSVFTDGGAWRVGETAVRSWTMIEAEMYGMMLRAKIVMRPSAPPENMSNMPRMPPALC